MVFNLLFGLSPIWFEIKLLHYPQYPFFVQPESQGNSLVAIRRVVGHDRFDLQPHFGVNSWPLGFVVQAGYGQTQRFGQF